jgi:hypothetical protein
MAGRLGTQQLDGGDISSGGVDGTPKNGQDFVWTFTGR